MSDEKTEISPAVFRDWLASKPQDGTFWFYGFWECALAQFAKHLHPDAFIVGGGDVTFHAHTPGVTHRYEIVPGEPVERTWNELGARHDNNIDARWTFGEAVDELDKHLVRVM
jgi:hypothetical protein